MTDRHALPLSTAATLAAGLPDDSRTRRLLLGVRLDLKTTLLAIAADRLGELVWTKTKDAKKRRNKPKSILKILNGDEERKSEVVAFAALRRCFFLFQEVTL